ncbi:MAG: AAA family ATPase, partial [Actinobacteria bacterium]|nr:AAA family ATPase [Actinomycetota bacterium]
MNTSDDTQQRPDGRNDGNQQGANLGWRTIAFFVGLLILNYVLAAAFYASTAKPRVTIPYSPNFLTQVRADNVKSITAQEAAVDGTLKHAIWWPVGNGKLITTTEFSTWIPQFAGGQRLDNLLQQHHVVVTAEAPAGTPWWETLFVGLLPTLLFFGLWYAVMKKYGGQAGGMFSFGQAKAKKYEPTSEKVTFDDVAGIDEAKQELTEVVDFLKDPEKYRKLGAHIPRGVLLTGDPGTGKTLLAKAVAGEADVPFFSMSASEFVEMIVGVGASRVRDLFAQAKAAAPSIIFIDEIDAIGRSRSSGSYSGGNDEREQTLNQILTEMDGFDSGTGVIVLAATNRPDVLDPALLRPGRFDRRVTVQPPDKNGREAILKVHTRGVPLASDVEIRAIAGMTPGLVGADLRNLVNEAALLAARRNEDRVHEKDFLDALEKLVLGPARNLFMAPDERERVAYHEG